MYGSKKHTTMAGLGSPALACHLPDTEKHLGLQGRYYNYQIKNYYTLVGLDNPVASVGTRNLRPFDHESGNPYH